MRRTPDLASLVAGLAILTFGGVLMAAATGAFELGFELLAPVAFGVLGVILLALGLDRER